ncbi:MAG: hypothetical protein NTZ93_00985 [Candidatus Beckwithbacteria bacterium]|nr:hypothetical protein [Candidatus Beckwithbacteria bacterium]
MNFIYEHLIARKRGSTGFVILLFFLIGFIMARGYIYLSLLGLWRDNFTPQFIGAHIHHFALGIFLVVPASLLFMLLPPKFMPYWRLKLAAIYGWGMGLIFDEFGMWLNLQDEYSLRHGYDAIIVLAGLLINVVYFGRMWRFIFKKLTGRRD